MKWNRKIVGWYYLKHDKDFSREHEMIFDGNNDACYQTEGLKRYAPRRRASMMYEEQPGAALSLLPVRSMEGRRTSFFFRQE